MYKHVKCRQSVFMKSNGEIWYVGMKDSCSSATNSIVLEEKCKRLQYFSVQYKLVSNRIVLSESTVVLSM